jgi:SAM-dependent methyltransferase
MEDLARAEYTQGAYFSSRLPPDPAREQLWAVLCAYLQPEIPVNSAILELGGGYCSFINHIRAADKHVVDLYERIKEFASPDVCAHVGSCTDLHIFPEARFDTVFASNLIEHLTREETNRMLLHVRRILKPQGKFIIIQPNFKYSYKSYFDDYTHLQIFTDASLSDLLKTYGFQLRRVVPRFLPFSLKSHRVKWRWLLSLYLRLPVKPFAGQLYIVCVKPTGASYE